MIHIIVLSLWLGLMAIAWYLAFLTLRIHYRAARSMQPRQHRTHQHKYEKVSKSDINKSDYGQLWLRLLTLVQFNTPAAERLLANCQHRYPDKSVSWCIEKTLWDLERDRY
ncbi:MAG: hypothetical protein F6K28_60940 [Microcoleus sp. SIO2G3]|nr:hypothetical protein [Microcoleus sp. SIO2G3]